MKPKTDILDHLGATLEVLRKLRGLSQTEFAEKAGIRANQVSRYETGRVRPQLDQLDRLAAALGLDVGQLFFFVRQVQRIQELLVMLESPAAAVDLDREWQDLQEDREALRLWIADRGDDHHGRRGTGRKRQRGVSPSPDRDISYRPEAGGSDGASVGR